jgi:hypothetical protein
VELEGGERVATPGGGLEREGEGERVEAGPLRRGRGEEAASEEEEGARGLRGRREAPERGVEVVGGRDGKRPEEEERVGQRGVVRRQREAVEEARAEGRDSSCCAASTAVDGSAGSPPPPVPTAAASALPTPSLEL